MDDNHDRTTLLAAAGVGVGLAAWQAVRRLRQPDWRGKVALVTGSSRGLGFLLARELASEGCRVVICARDVQELRRAAEDLQNGGADVFAVKCDIADQTQVDRMVAAATRHFGQIDILVNNAGVMEVGPLGTMTVEDFRRSMDIMFYGVLYPTLAVLPQMRRRRSGWIVNITSIGGKISAPHLLPYSSAKFAAVGFSEGLRAEVARDGVSVTTVCPGFMRTGSYLNAYFKGKQEAEFTWFSLSSSLPIITIDAERAAREIISAAKRGKAESFTTFYAPLASRFHGLFPGTTTNIAALVNRFLPSYDGEGPDSAHGMEVRDRMGEESHVLKATNTLGRHAVERFHEFPGPVQSG